MNIIMSEGGDIPKPQDVNPGQAFKEAQVFREEPYTLWFGDVITFGDISDANATKSVVVNTGTGPDFTVSHLSKMDDGSLAIQPTSFSTHGVEKVFQRYNEIWTTEQMKEAMERYFKMELIKTEPREDDSDKIKTMKSRIKAYVDKMRTDNFKRFDEWSANQSRNITVDDIREGKRKKV